MKFLVTGATSGLGRNAVEWLLSQGYVVHATGRNETVGQALKALGATFTALDLTVASDNDYQKLLTDCDIVWHCAALSSPWGSSQQFHHINTVVTTKLAFWTAQLGTKRFIHVSTPSIYFDFQHHHDIPESFLAQPFANDYAKTKYAAECAIQKLVPNFPATTFIILRPRGIFGPHDNVIIPRILAQIRSKKGKLHLPRGGQAVCDLTFVLNVVHALFLASTQNNLASGESFNITNQQPIQLASILNRLLKEQLKLHYQIQAVPYLVLDRIAAMQELIAKFTHKEPQLTRYSIGALHFDMTLSQDAAIHRLGYRPIYKLDEAIQMTATWFKQQDAFFNG
ncbi:NAD(P)-dependent oxidoreductase [Acinetobacter sp. MD2]|uniref:NAD-dependent epimerase/dehydratase family protein n=1 Tax=Acinetobacter sp. MD2 TaxID=2600066 RepID=UPI002D1F296C|nr:NAD(P)-dependent oxidoreductase [Acinetobacter sp. MD2]MEB3766846.1 NAD(P)-dependent oxidoreductase [Acinetobacter sp. MD2]